ncbi:sulfurtransferase [Thalassobaculum sp. OXR-137]|uniref:sulfurtransferase n=1 Tax=Thalassobaculum sp. OXR-137 TaxID=3100173 RepID=UPI002AC8FB4B|nr:sulfurtransferase [Thalassobaculum sp. OXR-137]WPZ34961.1 sulfurtransferase [Thalassobaculum sp. OXR-137]
MAGSSAYELPDSLVSTGWLAEAMETGGVRVFDCTCFLVPDPQTTLRAESGRTSYEEAHIPGAAFLDLTGDFSDPAGRFRFTMPTPQRLAEVFGAHGIGDGTAVVLYAADSPQWATRFWWMLRVAGFDNAAVLDGGLKKWREEGRPVESGSVTLPAATLTPHPRPDLVAGRDEVLAAVGDPGVCIVNALSHAQHKGEGVHYGRAGRIAGSTNVPSSTLLDPQTNAFRPASEIEAALRAAGAMEAGRVVPYCGGGIAASVTAYWLTRLGRANVALYDASLSEWVTDESLPMEVG